MDYSENELKRISTFLEFHLGKDEQKLPPERQIELLQSKKKRIRFLNIINVLGAVFFFYWFWAGITQLSNIVMYVIIGVFILNMLALNVQRKQLADVLNYLESQASRS